MTGEGLPEKLLVRCEKLFDVIKVLMEARKASVVTKVNASSRPQQLFSYKNTSSQPAIGAFYQQQRPPMCLL